MQQDPASPPPANLTESPATVAPSRGGNLGTLLLGIVIGGAAVAGLMNFGAARPTPQAAPAIDLDAIRSAARDGAAQGAREALSAAPAQANVNSAAAAAAAAPESTPPGDATYAVAHRPANTIGNENAPVTIVEYSDFECGFCRSFFNNTLQQVVDEYVKAGKVKISYKHFPFLADSSLPKAIAAECAAEQGKFWEMHNALFTGRVAKADQATVFQQSTQLAGEFGLDSARFANCLNNGNVRQRVIDDATEGQKVGVRGTPTFLINGKPFVGAQPYSAFRIAIEQAATRP